MAYLKQMLGEHFLKILERFENFLVLSLDVLEDENVELRGHFEHDPTTSLFPTKIIQNQ